MKKNLVFIVDDEGFEINCISKSKIGSSHLRFPKKELDKFFNSNNEKGEEWIYEFNAKDFLNAFQAFSTSNPLTIYSNNLGDFNIL